MTSLTPDSARYRMMPLALKGVLCFVPRDFFVCYTTSSYCVARNLELVGQESVLLEAHAPLSLCVAHLRRSARWKRVLCINRQRSENLRTKDR